jgi:hypothetical protein
VEERAQRLDQVEDEVLRDLAAIDGRLAQRAHITPSSDDLHRVAMAAVLHEDPTMAVVDGAVDAFSFDARARGLELAKKKISVLPHDASRPNERDLLSDLVDAESIRLDEERMLPRSASALVRALVATWHSPKDEREAADSDRWLSRRLRELREAMSARDSDQGLDPVRARELDDALDALEHLAANPGFAASTQELVKLRDALEAAGATPATKARSEWNVIARRVRAHLGVEVRAEDLARDMAKLEEDLRAGAEKALAHSSMSRDALSANIEKHVFASGACLDAIPSSRVRSMAAPPEREPACHLRHFVAQSEDDAAEAVALAVMHDHVVLAQWALDVARGAASIARAGDKHRFFVPIAPDARARYERIASARPVAAIGAGYAVKILLEGDPLKRAKAWSGLGEVPLDVAEKELAK